MLKILNNSLDGIVLGQKKADFDDVILNNPNYSLEFDRKHKIQSDSELITVSSLRNCDEFCLNGKVINFSDLEKFLEEEDPLNGGTTIVIIDPKTKISTVIFQR
ncbi:hypothetical protein [uncultured Veillonella sp.]|uniref:hypothetical protein n=1 Tax=uncultured Veillonella sp. TaxID=159268 RepID=UPI0025EE7BC7|nr:hypothetical protein [uncultured Veillonella sp.]